MTFFIEAGSILLLLTIFFNTFLAFFVYKKNKKSATNRIFGLLSLSISFWLVINYLSISPLLITYSLFLIRVSLLFAVVMHFFLFLLASTLPYSEIRMSRRAMFWLYFASAITLFVTLSPYAFVAVDISNGTPEPSPGFGIIVFASYVFSITFLTIYSLIRRLQGISERIIVYQMSFLIVGIFFMAGLIVSTIFIPVVFFKSNTFVSLLPLYPLIFLLFTTYAIIKHHLFDIKVIATELAVFFLFIMLLLNALVSTTTVHLVFNIFLLFGVVGIGLALIRSVIAEANRREATAQLAERIQKVNTKLKEVDRLKSEFLSAIKGFVSLLKEGAYGRMPKRSQDVLGKVYTSNERLVHLVNEFLNISHIEKGKVDYRFDDVDVVALAQGVADELEHHAGEKQIFLSLDNKLLQTKKIKADQEKLHHVIYNFVDNAIKYTEKGCVSLVIEEEGKGVTVRVCDEGIGFGEDDHPNFFKKFYRGRNVKGVNVGGTGLGLYVAREFIKGHKGKVWGKSSGPGKGSEFGFWVPRG